MLVFCSCRRSTSLCLALSCVTLVYDPYIVPNCYATQHHAISRHVTLWYPAVHHIMIAWYDTCLCLGENILQYMVKLTKTNFGWQISNFLYNMLWIVDLHINQSLHTWEEPWAAALRGVQRPAIHLSTNSSSPSTSSASMWG